MVSRGEAVPEEALIRRPTPPTAYTTPTPHGVDVKNGIVQFILDLLSRPSTDLRSTAATS